MKIISILLISIILMGCSTYREIVPEEKKPQVIEKEVIKEKIVYRDTPCNTTCVNNLTYVEANSSYVMRLIRKLKYCESQQVKDWNISECEYELNNCNSTLNSTMEKLKDILE